eukprot:6465748-Amphidinium_carterae.1
MEQQPTLLVGMAKSHLVRVKFEGVSETLCGHATQQLQMGSFCGDVLKGFLILCRNAEYIKKLGTQ